jgi:hypothetical protein
MRPGLPCRGELPGTLPPEVLTRLRAAARLAAVRNLAAALGVPATAVAVALLARAEAASDRGAARLARAVLGSADAALLAAAARAVGFWPGPGKASALACLERLPFDLAHGRRSSLLFKRANYPCRVIPPVRGLL